MPGSSNKLMPSIHSAVEEAKKAIQKTNGDPY